MHRSSIKQVLFWDAIAVLVGFRRNISVGEFIPCRGEAVYGTLGQCAGCAAVARSSALLSPGAGALDGRGREPPQRRTALQERQRRRLPAQRRESRVFPGRSSRSLSYRGILRGAAPELAGRSSPASIHRAGPGALHGCGRARKKPPRLQSSGPSARPNRAVEQSNGAPRHRHRECIWNQAPRTWDEHRIQSIASPSVQYFRAPAYGPLGPCCAGATPAFCASLTNSATETTPIFCITRARWVLMVRSETPSSSAISLLSSPAITNRKTSNSRGVSVASRARLSTTSPRCWHSSAERASACATAGSS